MLIIQMSGGLGNQMFQYALYLKLKKLGRTVKFDDETTYALDNARPIQLAVFGLSYPSASDSEIRDITDSYMDLSSRLRRRFTGRHSLEYFEKDGRFDPHILEMKDGYLVGNFQSEKYFIDIRDDVYSAFRFDTLTFSDAAKDMKKRILESSGDPVCIHVRRGDYLTSNRVYGGICTDAYYNAAMEYMRERHPGCVFYLFTDDSYWAESFVESHSDMEVVPVTFSEEYTGYQDMYLISRCRHHIIANSTFSWWGWWLRRERDGEVIAPSRWLNNDRCADILTDEMIRIDGKGGIVGRE